MKLNPTIVSWFAPTTKVDGSPVDYELNYEAGLLNPDTGEVAVLMVLPQTLQEGDGKFEAPIADLRLARGEHHLVLRAVSRDYGSLRSTWSDPVAFLIEKEPEPPFGLSVY